MNGKLLREKRRQWTAGCLPNYLRTSFSRWRRSRKKFGLSLKTWKKIRSGRKGCTSVWTPWTASILL